MTTTAWKPTDHDHLLYQWVKLDGRTQREAAQLLGVSQSTVSRVIQRYERWQAHAAEREGGRLDHSERLRAQRWQTFERNELILASCLRIAQEMEGFTDVSKSTFQRNSAGGDEQHIRTQHATIDRTGIAARFLRLAFRINMEQLKLASLDPPPHANSLTPEQLAEQERDNATIAAELANSTVFATPVETTQTNNSAAELVPASFAPFRGLCAENDDSQTPALPASHDVSVPCVNHLHHDSSLQIAVTEEAVNTCAPLAAKQKKSRACITPARRKKTTSVPCPSTESPAAAIPPVLAAASDFPSATLASFATALSTG